RQDGPTSSVKGAARRLSIARRTRESEGEAEVQITRKASALVPAIGQATSDGEGEVIAKEEIEEELDTRAAKDPLQTRRPIERFAKIGEDRSVDALKIKGQRMDAALDAVNRKAIIEVEQHEPLAERRSDGI